VTPTDYHPALVEFVRGQAKPPDKFSHMARLDRLAREVGAGLAHDADVVFAAVWLHDLGVFHGHRPEEIERLATWDHTAYAMRQAPAILATFGFPAGKVPAVVEAIRTHMPSGSPTTVEGEIVRDADILEQLGAVTVLRTAAKVGRDTRFPTLAEVAAALQKQLDVLPGLIRLPTTCRLAEPRMEALRRFLADLHDEAGDEL
jgi:uncharacterized protein